MADNKSDETPQTGGGRRRRAFEPAPETPPPASPPPEGMKRRRTMPAAPDVTASDAMPSAVVEAAEAAPLPPPPPPPPSPPPSSGGEKSDAETPVEQVPPGRRAVRIVLILLLMVGVAGVFYFLLEDLEQGQGGSMAETVPAFKPLPANPAGDELAATLTARILAGDYQTVLAQRDEYMNATPRHPQVLRAVYLAEAVQAVRDAYSQLLQMPEADTDDGSFLAVEERLTRLVPRMAILNRLTEFRNDWEESLMEVQGIGEIFQRTRDETFHANRRVTEWRRYQAAFEEAYSQLTVAFPNYEDIIARLQPLDQVLPSNQVMQLCRNLANLSQARNSVAANDMRMANDAIARIEQRRYARPPHGVEDRFEAVIEAQRDEIAGQFASWRRLWEESEKAVALYANGDMDAAVREVDQVIARSHPDSAASQALYDELIARNQRWKSILAAYKEAERQDEAGAIPARMQAWQAFALLLNPEEDAWQVEQAMAGAQRIKNEFNARLEDFQDQYADEWERYEEITSKQRQPSTAREEFAAKAEQLRSLAQAAEETLRIYSLGRTLELTDKSRLSLSVARQILAEQGGQAQSLWNLGRLYRDRGEIGLFRECLERIILLGGNQSNPFYGEARTLLSEGNAGG